MSDNLGLPALTYPFLAYDGRVRVAPLFKGLANPPFVVDLGPASPVYDAVDVLDQQAFQAWLDKKMADRYTWGLAGYLENRERILVNYPQMVSAQRFFHLGLDVIVPLGTPLCAPLDAITETSGYEKGNGNYGGHVLLRHESPYFETFYSLYGHLNRERLPDTGARFRAGEVFAFIGDFHENGNWFYHTHLQVITQKGLDQGYVSKGYCSAEDLVSIDGLCPSPLPLFTV